MGILYIVATPIGNLEDITVRAIKTLFYVDYIACEDTRHTGQLLKFLDGNYIPPYSSSDPPAGGESRSLIRNSSRLRSNNKPQLISYYDEIEFKRIPEIIELLRADKNVALVSDSGTPLISDPGYKLVQECIKKGIKIVSIPGPSSVITALISSGLPPDQFLFLGYLPPNKGKRIKLLKELTHYGHSGEQSDSRIPSDNKRFWTSQNDKYIIHPTIIFFETPHRLKESLQDLKEVFGDIEIVICRELTKIHEEVWRGKISEAYKSIFKGEIIILFNIPQA